MSIELENINYKKLNDINLIINENKITGILGNLSSGKTDLCYLLSGYDMPDSGKIKFNKNNNICLICDNFISDMMLGNVNDFIKEKSEKYNYKLSNIDNRVKDIIKMLGLDSSILDKDLSNLSTTEKIKVLVAQNLLYNPNIIILDGIIEQLDEKSRTKLYKLFIKLKNFYNKTIILTTVNIDNIYELIDDLIIINNGELIEYGNKFDVYENEYILNNKLIDKPITIQFKKVIAERRNIHLGNNDCINELIKDIYREIR